MLNDEYIFATVIDDAFSQDEKVRLVAREMRRFGGGFDRLRFRRACGRLGISPEDFSAEEMRALKRMF